MAPHWDAAEVAILAPSACQRIELLRFEHMRRGARMVFFLLVQLGLTLLFLEVALRIAMPHAPGLRTLLGSPRKAPDFAHIETLEELLEQSVLGFVPFQIRAGFRLNSRSLCTREYTEAGKPGAQRIMVMGDSYSFACGGVPFHLMWHTVVENDLNRDAQRPTEVFSLGVPAVGPMFELRLWQLEHERVRPDLVIVAFFVGNDFTDEQGMLTDFRLESPLLRASVALRLARNLLRLRDVPDNRRPKTVQAETDVRKGGYITDRTVPDRPLLEMSEEQYAKLMATRLWLWAPNKRARFEILADHAFDVLQRFHHEVTAYGADFMVVLIPEAFQIDNALLHRSLERLNFARSEIDIDLPQRYLGERLAAAGIESFDLTPALRQRGKLEQLYWQRDAHWNLAGNRAAGEILAAYLNQRSGRPAKQVPPTCSAARDSGQQARAR